MYYEPPPSTSRMTRATWRLVREEVGVYKQKIVKIALIQLLVMCYDNKMVKSQGFSPKSHLHVANQQKKKLQQGNLYTEGR